MFDFVHNINKFGLRSKRRKNLQEIFTFKNLESKKNTRNHREHELLVAAELA